MKNLLPNFQFRRQPFVAGLCVFIMLLFGGVTVKQNGIALGAASCYAITLSPLPAKAKKEYKIQKICRRLVKWARDWNPVVSTSSVILFFVGLGIVIVGIVWVMMDGPALLSYLLVAGLVLSIIGFYGMF